MSRATVKLILMLLASMAGSERDAEGRPLVWPYVATLATLAGTSERTVRRAVSVLESLGWLRVTQRIEGPRGQVGNLYAIDVHAIGGDSVIAEAVTSDAELDAAAGRAGRRDAPGQYVLTPASGGGDAGVRPLIRKEEHTEDDHGGAALRGAEAGLNAGAALDPDAVGVLQAIGVHRAADLVRSHRVTQAQARAAAEAARGKHRPGAYAAAVIRAGGAAAADAAGEAHRQAAVDERDRRVLLEAASRDPDAVRSVLGLLASALSRGDLRRLAEAGAEAVIHDTTERGRKLRRAAARRLLAV